MLEQFKSFLDGVYDWIEELYGIIKEFLGKIGVEV